MGGRSRHLAWWRDLTSLTPLWDCQREDQAKLARILEVSSPAAERGRKPETVNAGEHYDKANTLQNMAGLHRNSLILCHSDKDKPGHHLRGDRTRDARDIVNAWRPSQTKHSLMKAQLQG